MSLVHADPLQRNKTGEKQGPVLVGKPDTVEQGTMMRTGYFRAVIGTVLAVVALSAGSDAAEKKRLFDMQEIRNPRSLSVKVLQDWHRVNGPVPTRQKLVTIRVGEIWPGREYRMPVRMVVPANRKARGFHLTGGNTLRRLERDTRLTRLDQDLLRGGVGLVYTVVQVLAQSGLGEMGRESEARFARSLDPHDKIQYWAWPATMMRAITAAHAETGHFEVKGRVAMSGGSKNGATPSMAIIHDERMTAVFASVSPIWDSPLRLCDRKAWDELEAVAGRFRNRFLGGHFGPNFNREALAAGRSWADLQNFAAETSDAVFVSRNLKQLRARKVDMLFHPGTHDFVAFDLAWGGAHHKDIPIYLGANTGHGQRKGHPKLERGQQNRIAFLLRHFFPGQVEPLLPSPTVAQDVVDGRLEVRVRFPAGAGEESGRIWWMFDRPIDGSPGYLSRLIPDDQSIEMKFDSTTKTWHASIPLDPKASRIDFFSNHRKVIRYGGARHATYVSSPYTRATLRGEKQ